MSKHAWTSSQSAKNEPEFHTSTLLSQIHYLYFYPSRQGCSETMQGARCSVLARASLATNSTDNNLISKLLTTNSQTPPPLRPRPGASPTPPPPAIARHKPPIQPTPPATLRTPHNGQRPHHPRGALWPQPTCLAHRPPPHGPRAPLHARPPAAPPLALRLALRRPRRGPGIRPAELAAPRRGPASRVRGAVSAAHERE